MSVTPMPKAKPLSDVLAASGAPLDQQLTDPPTPFFPAQQRQNTPDLKRIEDEMNLQHAWDMWDVRLATVLNIFSTAMFQGGHRDWTNIHARDIRAAMAIADKTVVGDPNAVVPSGFGDPVRAQMSQAAKDALARLLAVEAAARVAKNPAGTQYTPTGETETKDAPSSQE